MAYLCLVRPLSSVTVNEDHFTDDLVERLDLRIPGCRIETRKSLLYDLSIDEHGVAKLAVDKDSGDPLRGGGKGFQQDILIYESVQDRGLQPIPKICWTGRCQLAQYHCLYEPPDTALISVTCISISQPRTQLKEIRSWRASSLNQM